ncbi:MAG TPA: NYN domain-containing protein [Candidatus Limnocylindrales bacterium]|nr:NYN domain-containing protein [Candidatus Limnocylindrales bacterium]
MGKNVAVFVDVANIFYAAKAAGVDIDYVTLLRSASAGRDLVRAYAYTGLDPDNENQRNFHSFLARNGYKVVSKDIRKYGDGKVKANLDIELVVDMMKTARNLDIAIVVSGDGDFAPAIRAVQEMGVRCEVISFRGNTSSDLIEVADQFTDITQLAKVEKGSRSGRRVAEDEQDLSMTEVPDKQTEGTGRGRGRGRSRDRDREPAAASGGSSRGRSRRSTAANTNGENGAAPVVTIPGEKLSKALVGGLTEADLAAAELFTLDDEDQEIVREGPAELGEGTDVTGDGDDGPRRRRRRGGRGRGRGRGRSEGAPTDVAAPTPRRAARPVLSEDEEEEDLPAPRPRSATPFGSVWDSQLGTSTPAPGNLAPLADEEFDDEPEIPEYLIAERNRGRGGRGRGGARGGRAAYQSAIARERYGRGGSGGINRYPDVSERTSRSGGPSTTPHRDARPRREERAPAAGATAPQAGGEWSEVPPELEEMLRAQLSTQAPARPVPAVESAAAVDDVPVGEAPTATKPKATTRRRTTKAAAASADAAATEEAPKATTRRRTTKAAAATADAAATEEAPKATTRRRTTKSAAVDGSGSTVSDEPPKPRRRTTKATAAAAGEAPAATTRKRTTRKAPTADDAS